jgi:surface carbohydrate biosynthesis protein
MIDPSKKLILVPVETASRELDFRLVLGSMSATPDNQVLIGNHTDVYEVGKQLRHTCYLGKHLVNVSPARMTECYEHMKTRDCRFLHLEEEGAIFYGREPDWEKTLLQRLDPHWLKAEDHVFTWGKFQRDYYKSLNPPCADNIQSTGHPRLNLSNPFFEGLYKNEIDSLRERFGKFILINTNCNFANHGLGPDNFLRKNDVQPEDREARDFFLGFYAQAARKVPAFIDLANRLMNAFPDYQLVLRPHPGENQEIFRTMLKYIPRAHVLREGSLNAWLHAAACVIHSGCTTGIEAWMAKARVINYQPYPCEKYTHYLPDLVGVRCLQADEVIDTIRDWDKGRDFTMIDESDKPKLRHLLENLEESTECFERLNAHVQRLTADMPEVRITGELRKHATRGAKERLKNTVRGFIPGYSKRLSTRDQLRRSKFPGLDPESIRAKLDVIEELFDIKVEARFYSSKLMSLHRL